MDILRAGRVWHPNQITSVRPTYLGRVVLIVLSVLRWCFLHLHEQCNVILKYICTTTLHTCVVLIGIFIAIECFLSNVSFVASLDLFHLVRTYNHSLTIVSESFLVLVLCVLSVANAVWLFLQVRSLWTRHLLVLIQVLHAVPSFLLLTQSLFQGLYLYVSCGTREVPTRKKAKHLRSQLNLNYMLLVYNITTNVAIAYYGQSVFRLPSLVYMAGDAAFRLYSIFRLRHLVAYRAFSIAQLWYLIEFSIAQLRHLIAQLWHLIAFSYDQLKHLMAYCISRLRRLVTYENDPFSSTVQEKGRDHTNESFCSGKNKPLPLLDVLSRWVYRSS